MKNIFSTILLSIGVFISAQDLRFEEVIKLDSSVSKEELYNRARGWAMANYSSKNNVIFIDDKSTGEISGSGMFDYRTKVKYMGYSCVEGPIKYNFNIYVKDGRYKYVFTSFDHKGSSGNLCRAGDFGRMTISNEAPSIGKGIAFYAAWEDVKEKINANVKTIISSLETAMNKKYEGGDDW